MLAGLQILVGVQVIDHLVKGVDVPRVQRRRAVGVTKGGRRKVRRWSWTVSWVSLMARMTLTDCAPAPTLHAAGRRHCRGC